MSTVLVFNLLQNLKWEYIPFSRNSDPGAVDINVHPTR